MYAHSHRLKQNLFATSCYTRWQLTEATKVPTDRFPYCQTGSRFSSIHSIHTFIRTLPISQYSNQIVQLTMKLFTFVQIIINYTVYTSHL